MEACARTHTLAPNLRSEQHYLRRQADVMQNGTDAGLVPGRRQNTMGLQADFGGENFIYKYVLFRQDTTNQWTNLWGQRLDR